MQDSAHTTTFCTQDCGASTCPSGYVCTVDRTGTKHQCYPSSGACGGGSDGGTDGGPATDPTTPSNNPNGCGFCGGCRVNNDCATDSICANGGCVSPCGSYLDCVLASAFVATCKAVDGYPPAQKYCVPLLGACLPLPAPLGGDIGCVPSGTNPTCGPGA